LSQVSGQASNQKIKFGGTLGSLASCIGIDVARANSFHLRAAVCDLHFRPTSAFKTTMAARAAMAARTVT
jgi:hypothetical protein